MRSPFLSRRTTPAILLLALLPPIARGTPPDGEADAALVRSLLAEDLGNRTFSFATIVKAASGKKVIPLNDSTPHQRVIAAIEKALAESVEELNRPDSPIRRLRRINEGSRFFEESLQTRLDATPGLSCDIPPTRDGGRQRSGYPDLRIIDKESGEVFYLDPKLVEQGSAASTFRSFYFEPKSGTLKINDDAVHLLVGIEHDGKTGEWTFSHWRLADLSKLRVRLKAEFQASNAELYRETGLSLPSGSP